MKHAIVISLTMPNNMIVNSFNFRYYNAPRDYNMFCGTTHSVEHNNYMHYLRITKEYTAILFMVSIVK